MLVRILLSINVLNERGNRTMDQVDNYRQIIEKILNEYAKIPYAYNNLESKLIISKDSNDYLVLTIGWEKDVRNHGCIVHLEIINGKVWIQRDGTEDGIATDLLAAGVPKSDIVLAFHPPEIRQHTGFAVC